MDYTEFHTLPPALHRQLGEPIQRGDDAAPLGATLDSDRTDAVLPVVVQLLGLQG